MKLIEILQNWCEFSLFEGRIETLKNLYSARLDAKLQQNKSVLTADTFIDAIASYDPSKNNQYTQWMLNSYLKGDVKAEDLYKYREYLALFDKFKNKLQIKDINKYTPKSLFHAVKDIDPESASSKRQEKQQIKTEGTDVVTKGPDCTILKLKTKEAACYYGRQTEWCTAATESDNMFDYYNEQGPLYVAICEDGRKFQFHIVSQQFMDENDEEVNVNDIRSIYPTIDKFFEQIVEPEILHDDTSFQDMISFFKYHKGGRWPEFEQLISKQQHIVLRAQWAARYIDTSDQAKQWKQGQLFILQEPSVACGYAINRLNKRWKEAEPIISQDPMSSIQYAEHFFKHVGWPQAEPEILKNPYYTLEYSRQVLGKRWPEGESVLLSNGKPTQLVTYALQIIGGRWKEAEKTIIGDPREWGRYTHGLQDLHGFNYVNNIATEWRSQGYQSR